MAEINFNIKHVKKLVTLCKLSEEPILFKGKIDEALIKLAVFHGVGASCYYRYKSNLINANIQESDLKDWKKLFITASIANQQKLKVYSFIQEILKKEGIPIMGLKGIVLASGLYRDEGERPMGDMDILVPEGMGFKALDVLLKAGATQSYVFRSVLHEEVHSHVRAITYKGVLIEIHQRLFSLGSPYHTHKVNFFRNSQLIQKQGVKITALNDLWLGYHLLAHAASNLRTGGLRFGWLVDLANLFRRQADPDAYIQTVLQIKPSQTKSLQKVVDMVKVLLPSTNISEEIVLVIYQSLKLRNIQKIHKVVNFQEILRTPKMSRKLKLAFREVFPDKAYINQWGGNTESSIIKLYIKRLFGSILK